jgi:hypothetical protein
VKENAGSQVRLTRDWESSAGRIRESALRGAAWLVARQSPDGSLKGGTSIGAYYKVPFALASCGRNRECDLVLDYVTSQYLKVDGDLIGSGLRWFETFRIYPHSWLLIAALVRGRFELSAPLLRFIISHFDSKTGGFFVNSEGRLQGHGFQEVMTTGLAALACLWAGRIDLASETGNWMQRVFDAQPDLSRGLYHVWDSDNGLVVEFQPEQTIEFLVDATQTAQWYFQYGVAAAFLSSLAGATGNERWLRLAQEYLRASRHCREDVYRYPTSGKIGWGAAWTYRLSKDPDDKLMAQTVAAGLIDLQRKDGSWSAEIDNGDGGDSIDETAEFVAFLSAISILVE